MWHRRTAEEKIAYQDKKKKELTNLNCRPHISLNRPLKRIKMFSSQIIS